MGIPLDGTGGGGGALAERKAELLEESGVPRKGLVEQEQSVNWNASFANRAWSIL